MEEFGLTWAVAGGIGLTAFVTTLGTWLVTHYSLRHEAKRQAATRQEEMERDGRYVAVRVVCLLDPFVLECCDVVADDGEYDEDQYRRTKVRAPKLDFPQDLDWRSVKPALMYRILTLPNEIENAHCSIMAADEFVSSPPDFDEVFEERSYQYAKLGLAAMDLARDLRDTYGLTQPDYSRWNPRKSLKKSFADEDERRKKAAEATARIVANHEAKLAAGEPISPPVMPTLPPIQFKSVP